ncbi:rhodanese-related sulfurtransferase [Bradyrhizobium sp. USDA 4486]
MPASYTSISPDKLARLVGTAAAPTLIDARVDEDFSADPRLILGAVRRSHLDVQDWASRPTSQSVIVVCHKGKKLSEGTAVWLRCCNVAAENLEGGQVACKEANHPTVPAARIDPAACPWPIRRFVDPTAVFLFVAPAEIEAVAERFEATPFDIENVFWSRRGELCAFDVMLKEFGLSSPALRRRYGAPRSVSRGAGPACGIARAVAHVGRRPRAVERRSPALRRILPMVPRRDQGVAQLANQQGQARPKA